MEDFFDRFQRITGVSKYSTSEVITPSWVVSDMVDLLPSEVFAPESRFLDPAVKSGRFLAEIYRRLMNSEQMVQAFPNEQDRQRHILANQLYGFATSGAAAAIARKQLYNDPTRRGNIVYMDRYLVKMADKKQDFKKLVQGEFGENMRFDVVIGNPPYQENTGGGKTGKTAKSLYLRFIDVGINICAGICCFITPSKWFNMADAKDIRLKLTANGHLVNIKDYINSKDIFDGVDIAGGVSYFLYNKNYIGLTEITSHNRDKIEKYTVDLKVQDIIFRSKCMCSILEHIGYAAEKKMFSNLVSGQTPFGLNTNYLDQCSIIKTDVYNIRVVGARGMDGYTDLESICSGSEYINKYKVITNHVTSEHAGETDKNGMVRVISKPQILQPNEVCTQTYMIMGYSDTIEETRNIQSYLNTKFVRLLIWVTTSSISLSPQNFKFVPIQDFTSNSDIDWSKSIAEIDQQLYKKYGLSAEEIEYIEKTIKPME